MRRNLLQLRQRRRFTLGPFDLRFEDWKFARTTRDEDKFIAFAAAHLSGQVSHGQSRRDSYSYAQRLAAASEAGSHTIMPDSCLPPFLPGSRPQLATVGAVLRAEVRPYVILGATF